MVVLILTTKIISVVSDCFQFPQLLVYGLCHLNCFFLMAEYWISHQNQIFLLKPYLHSYLTCRVQMKLMINLGEQKTARHEPKAAL